MPRFGSFFHAHAHSKFSSLDGMPAVEDMVAKVVKMKQPALALTDHGNMSGAIQLYKRCRKAGIVPFIGEEFYLVHNHADKDAPRYHIGLLALDFTGYQTLVKLSSTSHTRPHFHRKPRIDIADLADMAEAGLTKHLVCTTGCYFGLVIQTLINGGNVRKSSIDAAADQVRMYQSWFSHTFVEVQHHGNEEKNAVSDDELVGLMWDIANETGVPPLITQDSHYCDLKQQPLHDLMKRVGYYGSSSDEEEKDWTFPGDGYHLARESWVYDHYEGWADDVWDASQDSYASLLELNKLKLPVLDNYQYNVPFTSPTPQRDLEVMCWQSLATKGLDKDKRYVNRLEGEMSIVKDKGFADYFLMVEDIVAECRRRRIMVAARGSASGFLMCWLLRITQLDPIKWDLMAERFLSRDRDRPPDIDLDIDKFRRDEMIEYLASKHDIMPIGTYGMLGLNPDDTGYDTAGRGSMLVLWLQRERNRLGPEKFNKKYGHVKGMPDLDAMIPKTARQLRDLAAMEVYKHYGTHAAGVVVTDDRHPLHEYIPTMLVASGTEHLVTQMTMDDVEDAGYIKVDMLGLRSLSTVARALELIGLDPIDGLEWIPLRDAATFKMLRQGRPGTGVFMFEGYTQARGCREVGCKSIEDLILINALYRPATLNSGYVKLYLENRARPEKVTYIHDVFEQAFGKTLGVPVYQEQVLTLLRLLGFAQDELNTMLKAIKASNHKTIQAAATFATVEQRFRDLCVQAGMKQRTSKVAWEAIQQFSDYSFNRAHSAEYAMRGYHMAFLKVHHPLEFHAALLETISRAGDKKEQQYVAEARRQGIKLLQADVNVSNEYWTLDAQRGAIRRGLTTLKGIGDKAATTIVENRPYRNVTDLIERTDSRALTGSKGAMQIRDRHIKAGRSAVIDPADFNGNLAVLRDAGALKSIGVRT